MAPFKVSVIPRDRLEPTFWITLPFAGAFQRRWALEWLQALGAEAAGLAADKAEQRIIAGTRAVVTPGV
jgi:hypothetical protein